MPKIELTYQQILDAVKQLTPQEPQQLVASPRASHPSLEYPVFTADDPLWKVVDAGKGTGKPVARQHRASEFTAAGLRPLDAAHLACAEAAACDRLLTCDDQMIRRAQSIHLALRIQNPRDYIQEPHHA